MNLLILTLLACIWIGCGSEPEPAEPLNVLLLLADDYAAYAAGSYGSPLAKSPSLDRLAAQGVRFTRAYANAPVCTASRQSFITGRLPHATGVTLLTTALPEEALTLADYLKTAGYATAAYGKMHFNSDLRHGFDELKYRPEYRQWLQTREPTPEPDIETIPLWQPFRVHARQWLNAAYRPGSSESGREMGYAVYLENMEGTYYADEAIRFLETPREEPFFLITSFSEPHSPFHFPVEYAGLYDPADFPVPEVGPEDGPQIPLIFRDLTDAEKQGINAAYYTSVAYMDYNVGRVLDALDAQGLADNTLVIFAGDHGYNLGHHGRFEKHVFYEEAIRVPLIVRWPGQVPAGETEDALVSLIDLFPTVVDAAGLEQPDGLHGASLWPLFREDASSAGQRTSVVSMLHENEEAMIRTDDWKLIYSSGLRERQDGYVTDNPTPGRYKKLYDLNADPGEFHNLADDPAQADRVRALEQQLLDRFEETAPADQRAPEGLSLEEKLDWYVVPPETRESG